MAVIFSEKDKTSFATTSANYHWCCSPKFLVFGMLIDVMTTGDEVINYESDEYEPVGHNAGLS